MPLPLILDQAFEAHLHKLNKPTDCSFERGENVEESLRALVKVETVLYPPPREK